MGMSIEQAKKLEHFVCSECSSEDEAKRSMNFSNSPLAEPKVMIFFLLPISIELAGYQDSLVMSSSKKKKEKIHWLY